MQFEWQGNTYYFYYDFEKGQYQQRKDDSEQEYFTFNMLEEQGYAREDWGSLLLDGVREIDAAELTPIDIARDRLNVTRETEYYLDKNYSLKVKYGNKLAKHYIVVSIPPQEVKAGWSKDMFVQANTLVNLMYDWRYAAFAVFLVSLLLGIGSFLFLLSAAGHRKGTEEIVPLFMDKIWLDVAFGLTCAGEKITAGDLQYKINTNRMVMDFRQHGEHLNSISEGMSRAVEERMKSERFKTELITNVSHDIKTPLTSIINYVDLLEKEALNNATAEEYLEVLERQSNRLKKLIEDLMEASKASTGNLAVHLERLEAGVFMVQTVGEFEEKTKAAELDLQIKKPEQPVYIMADGRHFWRVIDNLMNNICKYAQPGTRVYINMEEKGKKVEITFRNTSKYPLNISSEELMERFVRGDSSRNTEGSGLGLSIANSLMELMGGNFRLYVDGDLFKVVLEFDEASQE